ncbi:hypothetical protein Tco_0137768 [Tanacetum coccineum]
MPPRRPSATARATVAAAAATPMTAAAVEQLIEAECTEGVVVLSQWFKKMESLFHISNYAVENQTGKALKKMIDSQVLPQGEQEGCPLGIEEVEKYVVELLDIFDGNGTTQMKPGTDRMETDVIKHGMAKSKLSNYEVEMPEQTRTPNALQELPSNDR